MIVTLPRISRALLLLRHSPAVKNVVGDLLVSHRTTSQLARASSGGCNPCSSRGIATGHNWRNCISGGGSGGGSRAGAAAAPSWRRKLSAPLFSRVSLLSGGGSITLFVCYPCCCCCVSTMSVEEKPNVVFVLGGPGAGKGTQCKKIVEEFGFVHLSAGDLLREERNRPNSEFGELIETHITNGTIVPVEITCSLLARAMKESSKNDFLIDGFPRNEDNLQGWNKEMGDKVKIKFVLFFKCDEETCVKRCLDRGAAGSGRTDDNETSLKKRFETYISATMPIIEHFRKLNLVVEIDANKNPEDVFVDVKKHFMEN